MTDRKIKGLEALKAREAALGDRSKHEYEITSKLEAVAKKMQTSIASGNTTEISESRAATESLLANLNVLSAPRIAVTEKQFNLRTRTALNIMSTRQDVSHHMQSTANYGIASRSAQEYTSSELQQQIEGAQGRRVGVGSTILEQSRLLSAPDTSANVKTLLGASLSTNWKEMESIAQQEGTARSAQAIQRRQRTDLPSMFESTADVLKKHEHQSLIKDTQSGIYGSASKINAEFDTKLKTLAASFEQLTKVIHDASASTEDRTAAERAHKKAREDYDEADAKKKALGGGSGGGGWGRAGDIAGITGGIAMGGAGIYKQWAIGREMDTMQLQSGMMGLSNQRYQDSRAAAGGDMAAILRIQEGSWGKSIGVGRNLSSKAVDAAAAEVAGGALTTIGAGIKGFAAGAQGGASVGGGWGAAGLGILGGLGSGMSAAEGVSANAAKLQSGATQVGSFLSAQGAKMGLSDAQQSMNATVQQNALDYMRSSWGSTSGAGANRRGILGDIRNTDFRQNLATRYGMGGAETEGLTQAGLSGLGRQFNTGDIEKAGAFSRAGFGSSEQYMGMRSQIAQQGGTGGNLETIMRNAVASGMDSSKNIMDMTRTMSSLASFSSSAGTSTFGGAAAGVAASIEALRKAGVSEALAPGAAGMAGDQINADARHRGIDIPTLVHSGRMKAIGLKPMTLEESAAAKMNPEQIRTLMMKLQDDKLSDKEKRSAINSAGQGYWLTGTMTESVQRLRDLSTINLQKATLAEGQTYALYGHKEDAKLVDDYMDPVKKAKMTPDELERADKLYSAATAAGSGLPKPIAARAGYNVSNKATEGSLTDTAAIKNKTLSHVVDPLGGKGLISGVFGEHRHASHGKKEHAHDGVDIAAAAGTPVYAVVGGKVVRSGWSDTYGNRVEIQDSQGNMHTYAHLQSLSDYKTGANVTAGMPIGAVGHTGRGITGNHLHWGVKDSKGKSFDPMSLFNKGPTEDVAVGAARANATGEVTQYGAGKDLAGDFQKILQTMMVEAKNLNPERFKEMVTASASTLDKSVEALAKVVDGLTGKLGGTPPKKDTQSSVSPNNPSANSNSKQVESAFERYFDFFPSKGGK